MHKVTYEILDYSMQYDLLQFIYDRWLFNTVSEAISSCAVGGKSAATSLDTKTFSIEYWRWHHRFLIDAVFQYGPPSIFITLSPFEWTFPKPQWLTQAQSISGKGPTELPCLETLNIVHTLEQIVRGYFTGTNSNKWNNHVFNYNHSRTQSNVKNFFYCLEFQGRGTPHVHLLVWLNNLSTMQTNLIRADIPWENADLAFEVADLQPSTKDAFPLKESPTTITVNNQLSLYHPVDAFTMNLRAYLSTVIPFLHCRMDVQVTDHKSVVSKFHDERVRDSLYSRHVTPYMAAYRHLSDMKPLEPEMVISLSSDKPAWTNHVQAQSHPDCSDDEVDEIVYY